MDNSKAAAAVFDKNAQVYQDKFMDVAPYANALDMFCEAIGKSDARILDVACGPGNICRYLLTQNPVYKVLGIDLAANMVALARENNPAADFAVMDCRDIKTLPGRYDGIVCGFCLPYLSDVEAEQLLRDAAALLAKDGVLYISTMEGATSPSGYKRSSSGDELYVHFRSEEFLLELLKTTGFEIVSLQHLAVSGGEVGATDMIIIARKIGGLNVLDNIFV